jgi:NAD(P)-dependent dehydrogenase (short-subunit alcohol dehydrogenase family)
LKTAVVIGVGPERGLGAGLCRRFAAEGLDVLVAGRTLEHLERVVRAIRADGGSARAMVADATDETAVRALFDTVDGEVDLAVYNAGNNTPGRIIDMDPAYLYRQPPRAWSFEVDVRTSLEKW